MYERMTVNHIVSVNHDCQQTLISGLVCKRLSYGSFSLDKRIINQTERSGYWALQLKVYQVFGENKVYQYQSCRKRNAIKIDLY